MRAAAVIAFALAVAACGGRGGSVAAPSNDGTSTETDGATAVPGRSGGRVTLGMTEAAVRAAMGAPPESDSDGFLQYYRAGISVALTDERTVDALHLYRGVPGGYENEPWQPFALRLPSGLTWDATEAQVIATMGQPGGEGALEEAPIPSRWIDYGGVMFDFRIDDGRMFHVVIAADGSPPPAK